MFNTTKKVNALVNAAIEEAESNRRIEEDTKKYQADMEYTRQVIKKYEKQYPVGTRFDLLSCPAIVLKFYTEYLPDGVYVKFITVHNGLVQKNTIPVELFLTCVGGEV